MALPTALALATPQCKARHPANPYTLPALPAARGVPDPLDAERRRALSVQREAAPRHEHILRLPLPAAHRLERAARAGACIPNVRSEISASAAALRRQHRLLLASEWLQLSRP